MKKGVKGKSMSLGLAALVLALSFFGACRSIDGSVKSEPVSQKADYPDIVEGVRDIEGCEYLVVDSYASKNLVHKGNCKNKIHYCDGGVSLEKQIEERRAKIEELEKEQKKWRK